MRIAVPDLPSDVETLQRLLRERDEMIEQQGAQILERDQRLARNAEERRSEVHELRLYIQKLKLQLAQLRRMQFGRRSERHDQRVEQLELLVDELEASLPVATPVVDEPTDDESAETEGRRRRALPEHLPREDREHGVACACPDCGVAMKQIGEDVSEQLEYVAEHFKVIRHRRPKLACPKCSRIVQAAAPSRPIEKGLAGPGLLAHVMVSKYVDCLPLYRQTAIYARQGVDLDRSTMAGWIGAVSDLVAPLVAAIGKYVTAGTKLHADDTPVPVLDPGRGKTKTGRLWIYVRDDRPCGSTDPPAAWYRYTPTREGAHPRAHLANFQGVLQADAFAGFEALYAGGKIVEAACWAHARRKFYDIHVANKSPIAREALDRVQVLYAIEKRIRGKTPAERRAVRQAEAVPFLETFKRWLTETRATVSARSELAAAINYALKRWPALLRYCEDGQIEIDNNAAERGLRGPVLSRKNFLFAGADSGGERAAAMYTLLETAELSGLNPEAYLRHVLERIADHPINKIDRLLPWNVAQEIAR